MEKNFYTHWTGWWVGPRGGLDGMEIRNISCRYSKSKSGSSSPYHIFYTDYTTAP